jgi:hypothetical protein
MMREVAAFGNPFEHGWQDEEKACRRQQHNIAPMIDENFSHSDFANFIWQTEGKFLSKSIRNHCTAIYKTRKGFSNRPTGLLKYLPQALRKRGTAWRVCGIESPFGK